MNRILVIDDERVIRDALERLLEHHDYQVATAESIDEAVELMPDNFDFIITDLKLPGASGIDIIDYAGDVPVLVMTSYASVGSAVESMKKGAVDYIAKPFDHDELLLQVQRALKERRLSRQNTALKQDLQRDYPINGIVGHGPAMNKVRERISRVAPTDTTVLIRGESGTGKELVARAIHEESPRAEGPIVAVNCAAIPENLIESELFGHEKGAFTGAMGKRIGLVETANSGTLFLDEIGELPPHAQAQLLRVLEDNEVRAVGASRSRRIDVRLVVATNADLESMCAEGRFRSDLYYRLRVMEVHLRPLRERPEDMDQLIGYMLEKGAHAVKREAPALSADARAACHAYPWPGNVRELENAIERAIILCDGPEITREHLGIPAADKPAARGNSEGSSFDLSLDDYFREFVLHNQDRLTETELARQLGLSRKALWQRRQRMGIPRPGQPTNSDHL